MHRFLAALIVLATPLHAQDIVPRDGTWTVRAVDAVMGERCPAFFAPMAEQMQASIGRRDTYDVNWGGKFDPNAAQGLDPEGQGVVWVEDPETGGWKANLAGEDKDYVVARMQIEAPDTILNRVDMDIEAMMLAEGGALPGIEGCTLAMSFVMAHKP